MPFRDGQIGDSKLKRFNRGNLADNKPITDTERKIFLLFVKGVKLSKIQIALEKDGHTYTEQQLFDIIRKAGFEYQSHYRQEVNQPNDKPKLLFADFVKGTAIEQLIENWNLESIELFQQLRKVGLIYATYRRHV